MQFYLEVSQKKSARLGSLHSYLVIHGGMIFFRPDCTVGTGITPVLRIMRSRALTAGQELKEHLLTSPRKSESIVSWPDHNVNMPE